MAEKLDKNKSDNDTEILRVARQRFDLLLEAESKGRKEALEDLRFIIGEQWPVDIKQARDQDGRPCLTINKLPQYVRQITNEQRQNRSAIKVNPADSDANQDTAKIFGGLIRHIEDNSNADLAYDTSSFLAVASGEGYYRVVTDYCDPMSFDQEILIKPIRNRFSAGLDPAGQDPVGADANWGFVFEDVPIDDYKAEYKDSKVASSNDWAGLVGSRPNWIKDRAVRVAEYFYKTFKEVDLVLLSDGSALEKSQVNPPNILPQGISIIQERKSILPAIKWCKINGEEILDKTDWLGSYIPILRVIGDEIDIDGEIIREGITRQSRDSQRMYNYFASSEAETISLAPRTPYIGVEGQFEGHEEQWKTANRKNHAFLQYKPTTIAGQMAPPPQRQVFEAPVQAITQARMQASEDMKATTGIYDATLGNRSNEQTGVAIQRRNAQSQTSNFHFQDNINRSKRHLGRILVDLIPKIYTGASTKRIIGEDGQAEMVAINQIFPADSKQKTHILRKGKYDVSISTGPSFATKREEASQTMLDLTKAMPSVAPLISDLIVRNMDWHGAQEIADRLKKTLPPGIADDKDSKQMPVPPQVQAQMQQMGHMIDDLTLHLKQKTQIVEQKTLELESKERIEFAKMKTQVAITEATLGSKEAITLLGHQMSEINQRLSMLDFNQPIVNEGQDSGAEMPANQPPQANQQQPTGGTPPGQPMGVNP